jgi:hypothetical protein
MPQNKNESGNVPSSTYTRGVDCTRQVKKAPLSVRERERKSARHQVFLHAYGTRFQFVTRLMLKDSFPQN